MDTSMLKRKMEVYDKEVKKREEEYKKEICRVLVESIEDEGDAYNNYRKLASDLDTLLNKYHLSIMVDMIADEEKNHKNALRKIYDLLKCSVVV